MALSKLQVAEESVIIVTAGSDTTSITLTLALYYLLKNRGAYARLVDEVDMLWDGCSTLEGRMLGPNQAPYLNAVINESLRIAHPDPNGNQ
jgi:cytochrome P450